MGPKGSLARSLLALWSLACIATLYFAYAGWRDQSEAIQGFWMMTGILTLPAGPVAIAFLGDTIAILLPSPIADMAAWGVMVELGYFQWFVALPWIFGRDRASGLTVHSSRSRFAAQLNSGVRP